MAPWLWFVLVGRGEEEDEAHGGGDRICSFQPDLIWKRALILHFSSWGGCSVAQDLAQSCFQTQPWAQGVVGPQYHPQKGQGQASPSGTYNFPLRLVFFSPLNSPSIHFLFSVPDLIFFFFFCVHPGFCMPFALVIFG